MTFIHPGRLFLETHNKVETYDDVLSYAEFLRAEAGLEDVLPVNLEIILNHFDIPRPQSVPLPHQQALLLDSECGAIVVNSEDPLRRQRFSLAHELAEMLFSVLPQGNGLVRRPGGFREQTKEKLCDWVAANLLMPPSYIRQLIQKNGLNFECAKIVSSQCEVSLTAALVQLSRLSSRKHCVVLWRMKNKPSEIKNAPGPEQLTMFHTTSGSPPKKLRVEWSIGGINAPFIPKDKSTEVTSNIYGAWEKGTFTSGKEKMTFDNRTALWFYTENMPFKNGIERRVISLIEHMGK
jgi:Zn-dependent peptidase ImmA (M78 family)